MRKKRLQGFISFVVIVIWYQCITHNLYISVRKLYNFLFNTYLSTVPSLFFEIISREKNSTADSTKKAAYFYHNVKNNLIV